jgi:predicted DNA-binding ribbon-helix-helix protein
MIRRRFNQKSPILKHSIMVRNRKTSISLEEEFWTAFRDIAKAHGLSLMALLSDVDAERKQSNLSSAIRLFVLNHYIKRRVDHGTPIGR